MAERLLQVPMERVVYVSRAEYDALTGLLCLSFDLVRHTAQHGLSSNTTALIASDCAATRPPGHQTALIVSGSARQALTPRSAAYNRSTAFSALLYTLDSPAWGFRSGLSKYYALHPAVYGPAATIADQGNWLPFMSTVAVQNYSDFGAAPQSMQQI